MQASTPGGSSPSLLRYRVAVASRALAAIGGGYLLSAACAATGARAMVWLGVERADAALGSTLLAFIGGHLERGFAVGGEVLLGDKDLSRLPPERRQLLLREAGCCVLIDGKEPVLLDSPSPPSPREAASASSLAYVSYTSGSSGTPKGVAITHASILRLVDAGNGEAVAWADHEIGEVVNHCDKIIFNTLGQPNSHVGVYVGQGKFVHAANERSGVRMDRLSDRYYAARFEGAKTMLD